MWRNKVRWTARGLCRKSAELPFPTSTEPNKVSCCSKLRVSRRLKLKLQWCRNRWALRLLLSPSFAWSQHRLVSNRRDSFRLLCSNPKIKYSWSWNYSCAQQIFVLSPLWVHRCYWMTSTNRWLRRKQRQSRAIPAKLRRYEDWSKRIRRVSFEPCLIRRAGDLQLKQVCHGSVYAHSVFNEIRMIHGCLHKENVNQIASGRFFLERWIFDRLGFNEILSVLSCNNLFILFTYR